MIYVSLDLYSGEEAGENKNLFESKLVEKDESNLVYGSLQKDIRKFNF